MAFEELKPTESSQDSSKEVVLWWVWKDHLKESILGYYLGEYEVETRTGKSRVILIYDDEKGVYFQAYTPKRYDFSSLPIGVRIRVTYTAPQLWRVEIDRQDIADDIPVPEEFSKDKEERELEALKASLNKQIKSKKHKKDEDDDTEGIDF